MNAVVPASAVVGEVGGAASEIERLVDIGGRFNCYSRLYLPADRFARILDQHAGSGRGSVEPLGRTRAEFARRGPAKRL